LIHYQRIILTQSFKILSETSKYNLFNSITKIHQNNINNKLNYAQKEEVICKLYFIAIERDGRKFLE
jgi:hypothetical protein